MRDQARVLAAIARRRPVAALYTMLVAVNLAAWGWVAAVFHGEPVLLGTALLAYGFGLRHAVDADHIAAIDNATRRLMQDGQRPVAVGLFFALGHSTVVILGTAGVAATATALAGSFGRLQALGSLIGTGVSSLFLLAIAVVNLRILHGVWRRLAVVRGSGRADAAKVDRMPDSSGLLARLYAPLFHLIGRSWHLYPIGFLFGLGFDTASEVALLGVSATAAAGGMSTWSIMVYPALFAVAMSLIDTTDGILMLRAYHWAFVEPVRKLYYNLAITSVSVVVALLIGGVEALGLIGDQLALNGLFWAGIGRLNANFTALGIAVIGLFVTGWAGSILLYRAAGTAARQAE